MVDHMHAKCSSTAYSATILHTWCLFVFIFRCVHYFIVCLPSNTHTRADGLAGKRQGERESQKKRKTEKNPDFVLCWTIYCGTHTRLMCLPSIVCIMWWYVCVYVTHISQLLHETFQLKWINSPERGENTDSVLRNVQWRNEEVDESFLLF